MNVGDTILFLYQGKLGVFEIIDIPESIPADFERTLLKLKRINDGLVFNRYKTDDMAVVVKKGPNRRI